MADNSLNARIAAVLCQALTPKKYLIGYESGVPKFLNGLPSYRCVNFLSASIKPHVQTSANISTSILSSYCQTLSPKKYIIGYENGQPKYITAKQQFRCVSFLSALISSTYYSDLSATILGEPEPWISDSRDLGGFLRQMYRGQSDLNAFLIALAHETLPAEIYPIPPKDLPAYLKVWPMEHLPGLIHGWQASDLGASIGWNDMRQLPAYIGIHTPKNLSARIKGWVREAVSDLGGFIGAFQYEDLGGIIRSTYFENLPAYLFCVEPSDLHGNIHGWHVLDLPAYLNGVFGPNDLQAYINATGGFKDLPAFLKPMKGIKIAADLRAYIYAATLLKQQSDLHSYIAAHSPVNLPAYLVVSGGSKDLPAFIYPKMVCMTAALSVSTMEHSNLGAVINFVCRSSGYKDLYATMEFSYLANLVATITGKKIPVNQTNLAATIGYDESFIHMDKLPILLTVASGYSIEDKIQILINIYKQQAFLSAMIVGTYMHYDMGASITPTWLHEYEFDNVKSKELVYDINHARRVNWYEVVEMYFKTIVPEYFYVGGEEKVYKTDRSDKWVLELASYVPADMALNIRRKLHRVKTIYDLRKFNCLDDAIRFSINYVTSYDYGDLSCHLNVVP